MLTNEIEILHENLHTSSFLAKPSRYPTPVLLPSVESKYSTLSV